MQIWVLASFQNDDLQCAKILGVSSFGKRLSRVHVKKKKKISMFLHGGNLQQLYKKHLKVATRL